MRANGWRGNVRGRRKVRTTVPDPANPRHPDLVNRDFRASRPGQLLVADFTYVPLAGGGFGYVAFCIDAFAGTILGWECSAGKATGFVQRAIAQAAARLRQAGVSWQPVHHSDSETVGAGVCRGPDSHSDGHARMLVPGAPRGS